MNNEASKVFDYVPIDKIIKQMCSVFNTPDKGNENP